MKRCAFQCVLAIALMCISTMLIGCASDGAIFHSMPDRMDGLFLSIKVEKPNNSIAVYDITKDGTLSFSGGVQVTRGEVGWSTELSEEQRQWVNDKVNEFGWLKSGPTAVPKNPEHEYEVTVRRGSSRMSCAITGDNPQIIEIVDYLDEICMARFDDYMQRLPQAGEPKSPR